MVNKKMKQFVYLVAVFFSLFSIESIAQEVVWEIGKTDNAPNEFALAPDKFKNFVAHDFGYGDKYFLIGYSNENWGVN